MARLFGLDEEEVGEVKKALRDVYGKGEEGASGRALGWKG